MNALLEELKNSGFDISSCTYTQADLKREREEKFRIFREAMLEINPKLTEEVIEHAFEAKFGRKK